MTKIVLWIIAAIVIAAVVFFAWSAKCSSYAAEDCPNRCVVCPPCEVCSSISCQTESFCKGIGFNRSWYEDIQKQLWQ
ncbi:MAG: hypothetical protein ABIF10_02530 [Candidatus Woesearchaeota archaeon]